jgi:hypothetical protein
MASALLACACAWVPGSAEQRLAVERGRPVCSGAVQCRAQWDAARLWVAQTAGLPIRVADDERIETYDGYPAQDPRLVVHVHREPQGDGGYRLIIELHCAYDFACIPDRWNAARDFNRTVARAGAG